MDLLETFLRNNSYLFPKGYPDITSEEDVKILEHIIHEYLGEEVELNEVALSPTQLEKPFPSRSDSSALYKDRGEFFLEKIMKNEEFELNDSTKIKIDPEASDRAVNILKLKKYNELGGRNKLLVDTKGNQYSLSQFKKTTEFGSGAGQGGGSANTNIQESSQSVVNSIAYNIKKGQITVEDLNSTNIEEAYKISAVTSPIEDVKDFITTQKGWIDTFISTANILLSTFPNTNFRQHRGSQFVNKIYNAYKSSKTQTGTSMQSDKWNPADIWMVDKSIEGMEFPIELSELNTTLANLFSDNKLIGVSLKKTGKSANVEIYNISQEDKEGYTYTGYTSLPTNNNSVLNYNDGKITFRTFNFATNFAGEIVGKHASHGKIGMGPINDILKSHQMSPLPNAKDVQPLIKSKDEKFVNEFHVMYSKIVATISKEEFDGIIETKDLNYLVSKYLSTKLTYQMEEADDSNQNDIISDILRYASSSTKSSSVFVKVS